MAASGSVLADEQGKKRICKGRLGDNMVAFFNPKKIHEVSVLSNRLYQHYRLSTSVVERRSQGCRTPGSDVAVLAVPCRIVGGYMMVYLPSWVWVVAGLNHRSVVVEALGVAHMSFVWGGGLSFG